MSAINDGGPAFPQPNHIVDTDHGREEARGWMQDSGMSLRDYFAAKAMVSVHARFDNGFALKEREQHGAAKTIAVMAYEIADAMLAERNRKP